jgi:putative acetyltransferase
MLSAPELAIGTERADHPQVRALLRALDDYMASLYPPEANHIMSEQELLQPEVTLLVARQGGVVLGCGAVRRRPGERATGGERYGEIKRMYVSPTARGTGLGARLLTALEDRLVDDGIHLALLETGAEQAQAVRLYEHAGYTLRGPYAGYPDNGLSLFFAKVLA